jgi:hypothetical protein
MANSRTIHEWLPVVLGLTVMGKLVRSGSEVSLVPDEKLGLQFSPHTPRAAAAIEFAKGVAGLAAVAGAVLLGVHWYYPTVL